MDKVNNLFHCFPMKMCGALQIIQNSDDSIWKLQYHLKLLMHYFIKASLVSV